MSDIERLISRYLDRELSPEEEGTFHRILSESAEARRVLREMEAIRSAARRIPSLTMPTPQVESRLFQQLFAEETDVPEELEEKEESADRKAVPLFSRISATARRRSGVLAAAMLTATLLGWGGFRIAGNSGADTAADNAIVADASASFSPLQIAPDASTEKSNSRTPETSTAAVDADMNRERVTEPRREIETRDFNSRPLSTQRHNTVEEQLQEKRKEEIPNGSLPFASSSQTPEGQSPRAAVDADAWPPPSLNLTAHAQASDSRTAEPDADLQSPSSPLRTDPAFVYAVAPSGRGEGEKQTISASYRHGLSYLEKSGNEFTTQDFSLRVEGRFDNRHRLSLAVGQSPLLVEHTTRTMPTGIALDPDGKGSSITSVEQVEHFSKVADEVWAGIGYGYALVADKRIRVEPGVNFGVGERSLRFSAELPIRYRLTDRFSLDLVASVSRVQPHDQITRDVDREYDRASFLHVDEEQHPVFTSVGASIGLSFDIGQ